MNKSILMNKFNEVYARIIAEENGFEVQNKEEDNIKIEATLYNIIYDDANADIDDKAQWQDEGEFDEEEVETKNFSSLQDFLNYATEKFGRDALDLTWEVYKDGPDLVADPEYKEDYLSYEGLLNYFKTPGGQGGGYCLKEYGGDIQIVIFIG